MELTQESDATLMVTAQKVGPRHPQTPQALALTSAFLLGSLSVTTEMERPMGLVMERSLLGRRDRGGGRPVRLRSTPSRLPLRGPEGPLMAREPFMVDKGDLSRQEEMR